MSMSDHLPQGENDWKVDLIAKIIIGIIFGFIIFVGAIGNILLIVLIAMAKTMHTTVNLCLSCVAAVDLTAMVFLTIVPWIVLFEADHSFVGLNFCVFLSSLDRCVPVCSALIFLLIGVERYTVLCHPLKSLRWWTLKKVSLLLVIILVVSCIVSIPYGYAYRRDGIPMNGSDLYCNHDWGNTWLGWYETAVSSIFFFLPLPVLFLLYGKMVSVLKAKVPSSDSQGTGTRSATKSRSQVVIMLLVVITMFVICLLPFKIYVFLNIYSPDALASLRTRSVFIISWVARILTFINHAANPVIYFLMSDNFREAFKLFIRCHKTNQPVGSRQSTYAKTQL